MFNYEKVKHEDVLYVIDQIYNITNKKLNPDIVESIMRSTYTKLYQSRSSAVTVEYLRNRTVIEFLDLLKNVEIDKYKTDQLNNYKPQYIPFDQSIIKLSDTKRSDMFIYSTYFIR